ncbi:hypothetical protein SPONL_1061 [uncultured Candidatus Thioglobus sp.]|nr:hypothetical protein SPONL_1061 [uncultured Candidatus Thioglobus sp.]
MPDADPPTMLIILEPSIESTEPLIPNKLLFAMPATSV